TQHTTFPSHLPSSHTIYTFPYTTLFRSHRGGRVGLYRQACRRSPAALHPASMDVPLKLGRPLSDWTKQPSSVSPGGNGHKINIRSEEHTSELQSQSNLVCRLLLEKKTPQ